jgi:hypothetical protein
MITKKKNYRFPKSMGLCADRLYKLKEAKTAAGKAFAAIEDEEKALKEHIINTLPKSNASGVSGKIGCVRVEAKSIPQVNDWPVFYAHVKRTGSWDLMQRRLSEAAVKARWEANKKVPGVVEFTAVVVRLSKV